MDLGPLLTLGVIYGILWIFGRIARGQKTNGSHQGRPAGTPSRRAIGGTKSQPESFYEFLEMLSQQAQQVKAQGESGALESGIELLPQLDSIQTEVQPMQDTGWGEPVSFEDSTPEPAEPSPGFVVRKFDDHRKETDDVIARRLKVAENRLSGRDKSTHAEFDARIRRKQVKKNGPVAKASSRLRNAVVWREILGPPPGLTDGR